MPQATRGRQPPGVSIDEALELFLELTYPNGPPDGVNREELLGVLRGKIAADRPEWAAASGDKSPPSAGTDASPSDPSGQSYAKIKAEIISDSQREPVPEDPEERYFYERAREVEQHREQRKSEAREERIRADLRSRLLAEKKEPDTATLERVLRIRETLERRLLQTVPPPQARERFGTGDLGLAIPDAPHPALTPLQHTKSEQGALELTSLESPEMSSFHKQRRGELFEDKRFQGKQREGKQREDEQPENKQREDKRLELRSPDEALEEFRRFNDTRRSQLTPRNALLHSRRPTREPQPRESLSLDADRTDGTLELSHETPRRSRRRTGLELE